SGRVRFVTPGAGLAAPAEAVAAHRRTTAPTPLRVLRTGGGRAAGGAAVAGLDRALRILDWLAERPELRPELPRSWRSPATGPTGGDRQLPPVPRDLPALDLLLTLVVPDWRLRDALRGAPGRSIGPPPEPGGGFHFRISPAERRKLVDRLRGSADAYRTTSPYALAQLRLLLRPGAWREVPARETELVGATPEPWGETP
ncbi:MAG: hypothetical protein PVF43_05060, partial [Candidatus Eiseniibacteriota bacterium]